MGLPSVRVMLLAGLLLAGLAGWTAGGPTPAPAQRAALDPSGGWHVQVVPGETAVDVGPGEYLRGAAIGPGNFQPGPSSGDWAAYRSINVPADAPDGAWCHPTNPAVFEVPNLLYVDRTAFGGRGVCYAAHLTTNPLQIGTPAGSAGRPKLTTNHLIIKWHPNPDYGKPGCIICGSHLIEEVSARVMQIAFSPSQGSEVWYFKDAFGQVLHGGNDKIVLKKDGLGGYVVDPDSNFKLATRISYGDGQTPLRPGDEGLPRVSWDVRMRNGATVGGVATRFRRDLFPVIPRNNTGHTYELQTDDWLLCALPDGYDARTHAVMPQMPDHCRQSGRGGRPTPGPMPTEDGGPLVEPTNIPEPTSTPEPTLVSVPATPTPLPVATPEPEATATSEVTPTAIPVAPTVPPTLAVPQAGTTQTLAGTEPAVLENVHLEWIPNPECRGGATRISDERLLFNWGEKEPPGMPDAGWCIKARTHLRILRGRALDQLIVRSDDGIRIWVGQRLVLDRRDTPPYREIVVEALPDGRRLADVFRGDANYEVHIEYVNQGPGGNALVWVYARSFG